MSGCECKTGFFALRDCMQAVIGRCGTCRRAICRRHASPGSHYGLCLDCAARAQQSESRPSTKRGTAIADDSALDDGWVYHYRHRFYAGGYAPIYAGHHHSTYYDSYDARSFEHLDVERDDLGDDAGAGFGDS